MHVQVIPQQYVAQMWPQVEPYMQAAQKECGDDYTLDQVRLQVTTGVWMLIGFFKDAVLCGAMAVSFVNYPNARVAFIPAIGGKNVLNPPVWEHVRTLLRNAGATKIQAGCRPSMVRLLKRLGFFQRCIVVEDPL